MIEKKFAISIFLAAFFLHACSAIENLESMIAEQHLAAEQARLAHEQERFVTARTACIDYGFKAETDAFAQCLQTEVNNIKNREAIAAEGERTRDAIEDASKDGAD